MEFVKGGIYKETFTPELVRFVASITETERSNEMLFRVDDLWRWKVNITLLERTAFGLSVTGYKMQLTKYHFEHSFLEQISLV